MNISPKHESENVKRALASVKEELRYQEIVGTVCKSRKGLGNYGDTFISKASPQQQRDLLTSQIRKTSEEARVASIATQAKQGQWMTWEDAMGRSLSWPEIWSTDQSKLSFIIRSFADLLPSPSNLKLWGSLDSANCSLCNSPDRTINHILS